MFYFKSVSLLCALYLVFKLVLFLNGNNRFDLVLRTCLYCVHCIWFLGLFYFLTAIIDLFYFKSVSLVCALYLILDLFCFLTATIALFWFTFLCM